MLFFKLPAKFSNSKEFWRDIKTINAANKSLPTIVDSKEGISEITHILNNKYEALYTSVPTSDTELSSINAEMDEKINCYNVRDIFITLAHINTCISQIKKYKSAGDKSFNSNHLINCSNHVNVILSLMFKAMLTHGHYPTKLLKSTLISIPKDTIASLSTSDTYRGISLFNNICKLLDYVIIYKYEDTFGTSDMQFGCKSQHSITMCTVILREVVSHYLEGNNNIYC